MRHAKSDWQSGADSDFDRPLNKRGRRAAVDMGQVLKKRGAPPQRVVSSPALRARQTVERVFLQTGWRLDRLRFDDTLYLADLDRLLALCHEHEDCDSLMLVGHNPGLEELLVHLCGDDIGRTRKGKLFTTANIAVIGHHGGRVDGRDGAHLVDLIRPR